MNLSNKLDHLLDHLEINKLFKGEIDCKSMIC